MVVTLSPICFLNDPSREVCCGAHFSVRALNRRTEVDSGCSTFKKGSVVSTGVQQEKKIECYFFFPRRFNTKH